MMMMSNNMRKIMRVSAYAVSVFSIDGISQFK